MTATGSTPLELTIDANEARLKIANHSECALKGLDLGETTLRGSCRAAMPLERIPEPEYDVRLEVELRNGELSGVLYAYSPPPLYRFQLPAYARLRRSNGK